MKKIVILYPSDYFDLRKVDIDYEYEYKEAIRFPEFQTAFYNYDEFVMGGNLKIVPSIFEDSLCIYRGWMLLPELYKRFYLELLEKGLQLINTPEQYENCHEFPKAYSYLKDYTPRIRTYGADAVIDWNEIKSSFPKFMMKDYVKSVKGTDFPVFFDASYSDKELGEYVEKFKEMRGKLFVGGIVIKEYMDLYTDHGITNEYRVFIIKGQVLTISKNSNQQVSNPVPSQLIECLPKLPSNFYTVDFAQLSNGQWIVIESGDGQVSGLSPKQFVFPYYEAILNRLTDLFK